MHRLSASRAETLLKHLYYVQIAIILLVRLIPTKKLPKFYTATVDSPFEFY